MSSAPTYNHTTISANCVVVAVTNSSELIFCTLGDKKWTAFEEKHNIRESGDIAFCNGLLYAINARNELIVFSLPPPFNICNVIVTREDIYSWRYNLLESCGELFMFRRPWNLRFRYRLFKLDARVTQWVEINCFFEVNRFLSSAITKFLGCWRSCMYFIHRKNDVSEILFCQLGDDIIERRLPMNRSSLRITNTWVTV
ncbi:putative F-box protein At3g25750 [Tasmannia lanceolata]|uniref:putative F-box protein At3g25750 n=1 Tax=Tasmannia lanceolata TaxID=3420 RepID=UPI004064A72E